MKTKSDPQPRAYRFLPALLVLASVGSGTLWMALGEPGETNLLYAKEISSLSSLPLDRQQNPDSAVPGYGDRRVVQQDDVSQKGEALFQTHCGSCHSISPPPVSAPPAWGIAMNYRFKYPNRTDFLSAILRFVKKPDPSLSIMPDGLSRFGSMAPLPLPDEILTPIAQFLWDLPDRGRRPGQGPGPGRGRGPGGGYRQQ